MVITVLENHIYCDEAQSGSVRARPGLEALKKAAEDKQDLKKKTHRGQMGQVLRGFSVGSRGYGYGSVPDGETKHDKKGRLRADGFKLVIVPGGGTFVWNRTTTAKDPLTDKVKQVDRPKEDWVVPERPDIRIISDEDWAAAQRRWQEIDGVFPTKRRKKGFERKQRSYVESHPNHLLSGSLKCGSCGGAISLVSGKGSGYYGCLNASRRACEKQSSGSRASVSKTSSSRR